MDNFPKAALRVGGFLVNPCGAPLRSDHGDFPVAAGRGDDLPEPAEDVQRPSGGV